MISSKRLLSADSSASIGIGSLMIFIAMVLVAGIAASVLIQTMNNLEQQALRTGQETRKEVSSGIAIYDIEGYAPTSGNIDKMAICVRARGGSAGIDLNTTFIELTDTNYKIIIEYTAAGSDWNDSSDGVDNIFNVSCYPGAPNRFGIMVLEDEDNSCTQYDPVIDSGDKVLLCLDTSQVFSSTGGINARTNIWGMVIIEQGAPGVISFRAPPTFSDNVFDLQ